MAEETFSNQTPIPDDVTKPQRGQYQQQLERLRYVRMDLREQRSFGIEWVLRLTLVLVQFVFPNLLVRTIAGRFGFIFQRVGFELYVLAKFAVFVLIIACGGYDSPWGVALAVYLLAETVLDLVSMIFLADVHAPPVSWRRSVLLLLINYFEITLAFAILYLAARPAGSAVSPFHGVFFSFITSTGVSYGPLYTGTTQGQVIVVCQICVMVLFLILFAQHVTISLEALKKPSKIEKV